MGIFGALVAVAWLADRARSHQETSIEKELPQEETFESLLLSDDYSKLKSEIDRLDTEYQTSLQKSRFMIKADNIKNRIRLADRAIEISETDEEKSWSLARKIRFSMLLESQFAFKNFRPTENLDNLLKLVESQRNHPAEAVQIEISFANLLLPILENHRDTSKKYDKKKALTDMEKMIDRNPDDLRMAQRLSGMPYLFSTENDREHYLACFKVLEDKYSDNPAAGLREISNASRRTRILATHRLPKLEKLDKSPDRDQRLLNGILAIVENERLDALLARRLLQSCRILESQASYALAINGYSSIEEKLKTEQNQDTELLAKWATDGIIRCEAIGKKFPLEFTDQTGRQYEPSDFDGQPVFIAILDDQTQNTAEPVELLKTLATYRAGEGLQPIVMLQNTQLDIISKFASLLEGQMIVVGNQVSKSKISQAFPATHTPIYLFLDGEQNLVAVTQKTSEVITRVNLLIHKVKKAQLQSN